MNNNRVEEIKKEDKKAFKKFIVITVIATIVGGIIGGSSVALKETLGGSVPNFLRNIFEVIAPYANIVLSLLIILIYKVVYSKSRKEYDLWKLKNEDDDKIDIIVEKLSYLMLFNSVNMILGFLFFGVGSMFLIFNNNSDGFNIIKIICLLGGFILCEASSILIQKNIINFEKEINPLLKGSVYDRKFSQKWLDSCDEAIKLRIYKSSYKAYTSVSTTCVILWLICIIGYDLWNFGVMPMVMVTIIWLVQTISYCLESIKQSKIK